METRRAVADNAAAAEARLAWLERTTEWPLTILALALAGVLLAPHVFDLSPHTRSVLDGFDGIIWALFATDLVIKLVIAPRRLAYLRSHWFDVILVGLPMLRPLRIARSARVLRVGRVARVGAGLLRFEAGARRLLRRHALDRVLFTALAVVAVAGVVITAVERDEPDATIHDLPDGLWWAVTTVTTVGYGDTYPKSDVGRGIGVALMLLGIALFGAVSASLAAYFVELRTDGDAERLREMEQRLIRIEAALTTSQPTPLQPMVDHGQSTPSGERPA